LRIESPKEKILNGDTELIIGNVTKGIDFKVNLLLGAGNVRQWVALATPADDTLPYNSLPNCKWRHVPQKRQHNSPFQDDASTKKRGSTNTTNVTNRNERQNVWGLATVTSACNVRLVTGSCQKRLHLTSVYGHLNHYGPSADQK
jgi:hypothetical protein